METIRVTPRFIKSYDISLGIFALCLIALWGLIINMSPSYNTIASGFMIAGLGLSIVFKWEMIEVD